MERKEDRAHKPLDKQGGLKIQPGEDKRGQDRSDPKKPRQPHFDESADRDQGTDPSGDRQAR